MDGFVKSGIKNGFCEITLYHPKGNSLPGNLLADLKVEIEKAGADEKANLILIRSEGEGAFCAGASFDELLKIKDEETGKKFFMGFAGVINAIRKCSKFVLVRVQGRAVGGGVGLIAAADYALTVKSASVKLSELALGIGPFVIGPAVERKIGIQAFSELTINFDWHDANWALEKGLYNRVLNSLEELDKSLDELIGKLLKANPDAVAELKKTFWEGTENWDELLEKKAKLSGRLVLSEHTKKYIERFKNERS